MPTTKPLSLRELTREERQDRGVYSYLVRPPRRVS